MNTFKHHKQHPFEVGDMFDGEEIIGKVLCRHANYCRTNYVVASFKNTCDGMLACSAYNNEICVCTSSLIEELSFKSRFSRRKV